MRKRRKGTRRGPASIPPEEWRNPGYRRFLREDGWCFVCSLLVSRGDPMPLDTECDPAHGPTLGMSMKGPDSGCIPLCRRHHDEQTKIGWPMFERGYGFDRERVSAVWWAAYLKTRKKAAA